MPQSLSEGLPQQSEHVVIHDLYSVCKQLLPAPYIEMNNPSSRITTVTGERKRTLEYVVDVVNEYMQVLETIDSLSLEEIQEISRISPVRNSKLLTPIRGLEYLARQTPRISLRNVLLTTWGELNVSNLNAPQSRIEAIHLFATAYNNGISQFTHDGGNIDTKDPIWDDKLVGELFVTNERAHIHFLLSHGISSVLRIGMYSYLPVELADQFNNKETLHGIISLGLRVQKIKGTVSSELRDVWERQYNQGGVQWHANKDNN